MPPLQQQQPKKQQQPLSAWQVFAVFLRLGFTSFGGPVAHLGFFRTEFVQRRQWLSERSYADLVVLCQFLPGPASSQVGMALGLLRAGVPGAVAAWLGFTLPSALLLAFLGMGLASGQLALSMGAIQGLKVVAVAVVLQAVWGMARVLCVGRARVTLMVLACCAVLLLPGVQGQLGVMLLAAGTGCWLWGRQGADAAAMDGQGAADLLRVPLRKRTGALLLMVFAVLLVLLPLAAHRASLEAAALAPGSASAAGSFFPMASASAPRRRTSWPSTTKVKEEPNACVICARVPASRSMGAPSGMRSTHTERRTRTSSRWRFIMVFPPRGALPRLRCLLPAPGHA